MLVTLSSKGQLVIPKQLRKALNLRQGMKFDVHIEDNKIVLEPVGHDSPIEALHGRYAGEDFLTLLELEHQEELKADLGD